MGEKSALINANAEVLYSMWRDVEAAPLWQEQIEKVTSTGKVTSHWVMRTVAKDNDREKTIEWDSEILRDEPGRRIAWRSIGGESDNAGEVVFEPSPSGRGTLVTVLQEFRLGKLASVWQTIVGRNPKQAVIENLRYFKALAETGEIPRTQGQPHGPPDDRGDQEIDLRRRDHDSAWIKSQSELVGSKYSYFLQIGAWAMKALCWMGSSDVEVHTVDDPTILNPHDAIIKITRTAICGSDLHLYDGFIPTMEQGDILGHEFMGIVEDTGKSVSNL